MFVVRAQEKMSILIKILLNEQSQEMYGTMQLNGAQKASLSFLSPFASVLPVL